jgi:uncharacterized protein (UPF0264 family)
MDSSADVIDIKEPARGSLGAADPAVIHSIVAMINGRRPASVALGELLEFHAERIDLPSRVDYVKLGLAGCVDREDWPSIWRAAHNSLSPLAQLVAVAYADAPRARSPHWTAVLEAARRGGSTVMLVDTYDKSAGGLLNWLDLTELAHLRNATRHAGIHLALAGSLTRPQIVSLLRVEPDFVAVRSAVCPAGRTARISRRCIDAVAADLRAARS